MIIVLAPPLLWAPAFSYGSEHTSGIDNVICAGGAPLNGGIVLLQACAVVGDGSDRQCRGVTTVTASRRQLFFLTHPQSRRLY